MDLIFPVCDPYPNCTSQNALYIIYNAQKPLCQYIWDSEANCRSSTNLCVEDSSYTLADMSVLQNTQVRGIIRLKLDLFICDAKFIGLTKSIQ